MLMRVKWKEQGRRVMHLYFHQHSLSKSERSLAIDEILKLFQRFDILLIFERSGKVYQLIAETTRHAAVAQESQE